MTILTLAAIIGLATNPACGGARPDSELADHLVATALKESGDKISMADPLFIGVNKDATHPAMALRSATVREAIAKAYSLLAQGRSFDLGLMQENIASLHDDGLTIETAFDACSNMAAGARHFDGNIHTVLNLAHRLYNSGKLDHGVAYAQSIDDILVHIRSDGHDAPQPATEPAEKIDPNDPPPPYWDMEAVANWRRRHNPTPEEAALAADVEPPVTVKITRPKDQNE